jgi:hypothetical protein
MGLSATGKCIVLCMMLDSILAGMASGSSTEAAARELLSTKTSQPLTGWNPETMARYAHVGRKLQQLPSTLSELELMEYRFGRASLFDGITSLRSLVGPVYEIRHPT